MKYLLALILGLLTGIAAAALLLIYNPMAGANRLSPLSVSDQALIRFSYSGVADNTIAYTNDGESTVRPFPAKILQLWEAPVRRTDALMTLLTDARGQNVGLGIKYMSDSEASSVTNGEAIIDSVWHIVIPGRGTLFVEQSENYWSYLRDVVLPAQWSSGKSWKGNWTANTTAGPGPLGTARVTGGSGEFAGANAEAVESLDAKAYSTRVGPVSLDGHITIEMSRDDDTRSMAADSAAELAQLD